MRVTEPALPRSAVSATSNVKRPRRGGWVGAKSSSVDPSRSPETTAPLIVAAALTAERCCDNNPGLRRPARMFSRRKARVVTLDRLKAVRNIWPPPSPYDPSKMRTSAKFRLHPRVEIKALNPARARARSNEALSRQPPLHSARSRLSDLDETLCSPSILGHRRDRKFAGTRRTDNLGAR